MAWDVWHQSRPEQLHARARLVGAAGTTCGVAPNTVSENKESVAISLPPISDSVAERVSRGALWGTAVIMDIGSSLYLQYCRRCCPHASSVIVSACINVWCTSTCDSPAASPIPEVCEGQGCFASHTTQLHVDQGRLSIFVVVPHTPTCARFLLHFSGPIIGKQPGEVLPPHCPLIPYSMVESP